MTTLTSWLAAAFLPLFPLSMVFNVLFSRVRSAPLRAALLLAWPQLGLSLALAGNLQASRWFAICALFTSALYAFRAISVREVGQWIGYLATSAWALLWLVLFDHASAGVLRLSALGFSVPLVLLALLGDALERRFGAAYTGLYGGLAQRVPRLSGVLVCVVLAVIAVPLFPSFFAMFATVAVAAPTAPFAALTVAAIWLLWSWAGVRLLQGLIVGPADGGRVADISVFSTWAYAAVLVMLFASGLYVTGGLLR